MPDNKFDKYFTADVLKESPKFPGYWDCSSTRHFKHFGGGHLSIDCIHITQSFVMVSQPHQHEFPQYLHFFSASSEDQRIFDAEIEISLGEDEAHMEKHVVTRPTALNPHSSQGFVARRCKRMWMQGLRPRTPEAYFMYVEEPEGAERSRRIRLRLRSRSLVRNAG